MNKVEWASTKTEVDVFVCEYLDKTLGRGHIHRKDIIEFISNCRKSIGVDAICLLEENLEKGVFEVTYGAFAEGIPDLIGMKKDYISKEGVDARSLFDEDGLHGYCKRIKGEKAHVLSFGIFQEEVYEGALCFVAFGDVTYEWSGEEKSALIKIGRVLQQKVAMTHERRMRKKLEDALNGERHQLATANRYMNALNYFTNGYFETNLTKGKITEGGKLFFSRVLFEENLKEQEDVKTFADIKARYMELISEEDWDAFDEFFDRKRLRIACGTRERIQKFRFKSRILDDGERWFEVLILLSKDEATGDDMALHFFNDVTKEVTEGLMLKDALVEAHKSEAAKNTFLFNMSHDIRTPMNSILGFTALAKKHLHDAGKAMDYLNKAEESENQLLHLINQILDMARLEDGKVGLHMNPMNILEELKKSEGVFRDEMVKRGIHFSVYKKITHPLIICDNNKIRQISMILVENAMKYTKPGGKVMLKITETNEVTEGKTWYEIKVKDTGVGMSEEFQKHLFHIFEREQKADITGNEGAGLGLAILKGLVDLMGGRVEIASKENEGTEVLVYIPVQVFEGNMEEKTDKIEKNAFVNKKVLLVEDNMLNREIAKELLEEEGLVVTEAEDGSVALQIMMGAKSKDFDLVLMDIQMPFMDGYLATQAIRSLPDTELAQIPIIAMTANAFEEDRKKTLEAGMNEHIAKPIDMEKLLLAMSRVLK